MGITESEILRYIVQARESQSREKALQGLLAGRSFSDEDAEFVKTVLYRFSL